MAQPQQYHPPPYASPHSTPSPLPQSNNPAFAPPIKRPQLSPTSPATPYYQPLRSPGTPNGSNLVPANPYVTQNTNPYPIQQNHAMSPGQPPVRQTPPPPPTPQPQQAQAQGTMGPPSKPDDEKPMDLNDIADVMTGSGVDLKAEEAALNYGSANAKRPTTYAYMGQPGYFDPQRNTLQPNTPGGRDSFYGAGTFNQTAVDITPRALEDEVEARERIQKRRKAERDQFHANEPFLLTNTVMKKVHAAAQKAQTMVNMEGVFHPRSNSQSRLVIVGPEGQDRIATLLKEPLLTVSSPMVDVLTLLSFAARERIRMVLEDSATYARGRRTTANGKVPPDFADIAVGAGNPSDASAEPMALIGAEVSQGNPRKRSLSQTNELPTPVSEIDKQETPVSLPTIEFPNLTTSAIQMKAEEDETYERERLAKRQKRATASLISSTDPTARSNSFSGTSTPGTPGVISDSAAPEAAKLTKKEQKRMQEERAASSAVKDTRNAVNMALGGGKRPSWMTSGKAGGGGGLGTSFAKRTPAGAPAKKPEASSSTTPAAGSKAPAPGATVKGGRVLGEFREDREDGTGIQMRDVLAALDDSKERKTLSRGFAKANKR